MGWLLDEPSLVLVCVAIGVLLLVVEVALPTFGVAGAMALAAGVIAVVAVAREEMTWWPLLGPVAALGVWASIIVLGRRAPPAEIAAVVLFVAGGAAFAIANDDTASLLVTAGGAPLLAVGFPHLHRAATELLQRPSEVGMDALVGRTAAVDRWECEHGAGVVLLEGSRWNAVAPTGHRFAPGDNVTVVGYRGSTVDVWPQPRTPAAN